eukprot:10742014-Alexandrium_andersonii.AAC.1
MARWADEAIFGGRGGHSALDSAWAHTFELEHTSARASQLSSLSVDLYMCFDQVDRRALTQITTHLGAPSCVVAAWGSVVRQLRAVSTLAEG